MAIVPLLFHGLRNTMCRARVPFDYAYRMWNADIERGSLQARLGFGENFKRSSWTADDLCFGAGYGKYAGTEQVLLITQRGTETAATVEVRDLDGTAGVSSTSATSDWTTRDSSNWEMTQFDNYIYAVNPTDGLWRWEIGGSIPDDWKKVPTRFYYGADSVIAPYKPPYPYRQYETTAGASFDTISMRLGSSASTTINLTSTVTVSTDGVVANMATIGVPDNKFVTMILAKPNATYTAMSFTSTRMFACSMNVYMSSTLITNSATWLSGGSFSPACYVSTVAAASTTNLTSSDWVAVPAAHVVMERVVQGALYPVAHFYVNLDALRTYGTTVWPEANFAAIRKIAFGAWVNVPSNRDFNVEITRLTLGGNPLNRPDTVTSNFYGTAAAMEANANLKDVEYAYQYYDSSNSVGGDATVLVFPRSKVFGEPYFNTGLPPMGSVGRLEIVSTVANTPTYDKIRIWRKRRSDSDKWHLLETINNPGIGATATTAEDTRIDSAEYSWGTTVTAASLPVTQGQGLLLQGGAVAAWKTHMVVGVDNELYFSWANDPSRYIPPVRLLGSAPLPTDDPTVGRTVYLSNDQADVVVSLVANDALYAVGERGIYAIIGDSAIDATSPRQIAKRGALNSRAVCAYAGGVVVGSSDGLWWYRVSRASVDSNQTSYDEEELTKEVRFSYAELLKDGESSDLVVCEDQGQIWLFRGIRYMKRSRDGEWFEGMLDADSIESGATGTADPDYPVVGGTWPTDNPTGVPGTNWTIGASGLVPLGHTGTGTNTTGDDDYTPGTGGHGTLEPTEPGGIVLSGNTDPYGVIAGISVPYKGFKFVSHTGIVFNSEFTEDLIPYRSDAGRPINWFWTGGVLGDERTEVSGVKMFASNILRGLETATTQPGIRFIWTSFDGKAGESIYIHERPAEMLNSAPPVKNDVQLLTWPTRRGYRHVVTVASLDASQIVDGCTLTIENAGLKTGQGN